MRINDKSLREGFFAQKQIFSRDWLISWSHRSRFQMGLELAQQFAGKRVLDYGCGDGSFLAMLMNGPAVPSAAVGVELSADSVADCERRLGGLPGLSFIVAEELDQPRHEEAYDAVFCMEVLEHVIDVETIINRMARLLAPKGKLLVSVPIETGPSLLIKQAARRIAGWRGIGDYPGTNPYSLRELTASLLASGERQHIERPVHTNPDGSCFHDHKGFNWMLLRELLAREFDIEKQRTSPLPWLTPYLASQVWFLLQKKQSTLNS